jgi:predicted transcriptional regulator
MRFLHTQGEASTRSVAEAMGDKYDQTYMDLRDLVNRGLAEKHDGEDTQKLWAVTDKGIVKYQELARDLNL